MDANLTVTNLQQQSFQSFHNGDIGADAEDCNSRPRRSSTSDQSAVLGQFAQSTDMWVPDPSIARSWPLGKTREAKDWRNCHGTKPVSTRISFDDRSAGQPTSARTVVSESARFCADAKWRRPMPQFAATIKHIQEGVKGFTISAAVKNIEGWEETLKDVDEPGVKNVTRDLGSLKKHLQAAHIDGDAVSKLVAKLGKDSIALAGTTDSKVADQVRAIGHALEQAPKKI